MAANLWFTCANIAQPGPTLHQLGANLDPTWIQLGPTLASKRVSKAPKTFPKLCHTPRNASMTFPKALQDLQKTRCKNKEKKRGGCEDLFGWFKFLGHDCWACRLLKAIEFCFALKVYWPRLFQNSYIQGPEAVHHRAFLADCQTEDN